MGYADGGIVGAEASGLIKLLVVVVGGKQSVLGGKNPAGPQRTTFSFYAPDTAHARVDRGCTAGLA